MTRELREEWWQGTMRPATNAEILAVFVSTPDADAGVGASILPSAP